MFLFSKFKKNRVQRSFILFGMTALLLLTACGQWRGVQIKPTETRIDVVREIVRQNWEQLETLHGFGRIIMESPRQSFSGRAVVNVKVPDSVYIKIEAILGLDVGVIFADKKSFLVFSPMEKLAYAGASEDTLNLKMYLGFDLTFPMLMHLISGVALLPDLDDAVMHNDGEQLEITGRKNGLSFEYSIDTKFGMVSKVIVRDDQGQVHLIEEYKRFVRVGSVRAPKMMRYIRPARKESLTLFYEQLDVNKPIPPKDFYIKLPKDILKIRL